MKYKLYSLAVILAVVLGFITVYFFFGNKSLPRQQEISIQKGEENHEIYEEIDKEILLLEHSSPTQHN